jgi:hypothetical protein
VDCDEIGDGVCGEEGAFDGGRARCGSRNTNAVQRQVEFSVREVWNKSLPCANGTTERSFKRDSICN